MLEAQAGSFLSAGGMLREGLLLMAEEIALLPGMEALSSKKQTVVLTRTCLISPFGVSNVVVPN